MDSNAWRSRKAFLFLTETDEAALGLLRPILPEYVDGMVDAFYRHLVIFSETRRLLSDPMLVQRLKEAQKTYLLSLVTGPYDEAYEQSRLQIGHVHDRIGLTPQWYLGAYALYLNLFRSFIFREFRHQPDQLQAVLTALTKVIFLDVQLAIEAYIEKASERQVFESEQLATLGRTLETEVMQQKKDLLETQERLRETERIAELGTLASTVAHEIGTPLNVILGRAEYVLKRVSDETAQRGLQAIVTQADRISKIMTQTLNFTRNRPIERRETDLRQTIQESLDWISERIARRTIQLEVALEANRSVIWANSDQMNQVLLNLMINAIDAMPQGGMLRIRLEQHDAQVKVIIADTGIGIPKEQQSKIFQPFFTTKEKGKGTGLGLAIVQNIVHEHSGSIAVESEPGRGTAFTISLPTYYSDEA